MVSKPLHLDKHGKLCILSVDDDSVNLMVMEQLLAAFDWKVVSAMDGVEALEVLEGDAWPDFVFLDFHMQCGDSGDEICRKMRAIFGSTPVPIVMCTALSAGSDAIDFCLEAGASDFLLKPYERAKVLGKVDKYVGEKLRMLNKGFDLGAPAHRQASAVQPALVAKPEPAASPACIPLPLLPSTQDLRSAVSSMRASEIIEGPSVQRFCSQLDLEYCGKKLTDAGVAFHDLKAMNDVAFRKAGIVVKAQRDKLMEAVTRLP